MGERWDIRMGKSCCSGAALSNETLTFSRQREIRAWHRSGVSRAMRRTLGVYYWKARYSPMALLPLSFLHPQRLAKIMSSALHAAHGRPSGYLVQNSRLMTLRRRVRRYVADTLVPKYFAKDVLNYTRRCRSVSAARLNFSICDRYAPWNDKLQKRAILSNRESNRCTAGIYATAPTASRRDTTPLIVIRFTIDRLFLVEIPVWPVLEPTDGRIMFPRRRIGTVKVRAMRIP